MEALDVLAIKLRNGDVIETKPVSYPVFSHYAVAVKIREEWWVIHNIQLEGVTKELLSDLLKRHEVNSVRASKITGWSTDKILKRYDEFDKLKYNLVYYNCESFVNDFTGEKPRSLQSIFFGLVILIVLFFLIYKGFKLITKLN